MSEIYHGSESSSSTAESPAGMPVHPSQLPDPRDERPYRRLSRVVSGGRIWIFIAILGVALSSVVMLIYALIALFDAIFEAIFDGDLDVEGANELAVNLIELTDIFLLGMVLYVVALGMYQLFIDRWIPVPSWMRVDNLQQLKNHLISVIVVLMAVSFLGDVVRYESGPYMLYEGGAIALVTAGLSAFVYISHRTHHDDRGRDGDGDQPHA